MGTVPLLDKRCPIITFFWGRGGGGWEDLFLPCGVCSKQQINGCKCQKNLISKTLTYNSESLFHAYHCGVDHLLDVCCPSGCQYQAQMGLVIGLPVASSGSEMVNWVRDDIGMENEGNLLVQSSQLVFRIANYLLGQQKTFCKNSKKIR